MAPPLLTLQDIRLTFGGTPLLENANLSVFEGDRLCVVGRNGSGKSTLLKIAAGLLEPESGTRFVTPGLTVQYLEQEPDLSAFSSVLDYVLSGHVPDGCEHRARGFLERLGVDPAARPDRLSGGETRRAALSRMLALEPDILMLDEPTNHLDLPAIEWLEGVLARLRGALVLISHDRRFLENLSRRTLWLDRGTTRMRGTGFAGFESWRDKVLEQEALERHKLARKIDRETHWLIHGVTGRRKRNQRRLAALQALRLKRQKLADRATRNFDSASLSTAEARASGKLVVETRDLCKSWDGRPVVRNLSMRLHRGGRLGIIGPNGAGKTTLIRLLTGSLAPDSGSIRFGTRLETVTLDQKRESLSGELTLQEALTQGRGDMVQVGETQRHVIGYMKDFLFAPEQARTPLRTLSGGERGRLMLARAFARPSNMLVLDEPTNDLDFETLDLLQELLADYRGTVLLVSHDRDFLDRVVTNILASEGDGCWTAYAGGYSDMAAQKQGKSGTTKKQPSSPKAQEKTRSARQTAQKTKTKLSFKEAHALKTLPDEIRMLEQKLETLKKRLEDSSLYARDPAAFQKTADALEKTQAELTQKEEAWLELELLRESLEEGGKMQDQGPLV